MKEFIQTYLNKLDITTIIENILTKVLSLLFLFLLFYIAKKLLHTMVQRIVKPSLINVKWFSDARHHDETFLEKV